MNEIEMLKHNYDKMNYLEKLEYLNIKVDYIESELKKVENEIFAKEFIEENLNNLMTIISVFSEDLEFNNHILQNIYDLIEVIPLYLKNDGTRLSIIIKIMEDLV